jgi:hypothetical protein
MSGFPELASNKAGWKAAAARRSNWDKLLMAAVREEIAKNGAATADLGRVVLESVEREATEHDRTHRGAKKARCARG